MMNTKRLRDLAAASNDGNLCGPALQAADVITALEAERDALKAENERLREALVFVRDTKPIFDYAAVRNGRADLEAPGSPYDRGKADAYRLFSKYARAALEQGEG